MLGEVRIRWSAGHDCITIGCLWIRHRLVWPAGTGQQAKTKIRKPDKIEGRVQRKVKLGLNSPPLSVCAAKKSFLI